MNSEMIATTPPQGDRNTAWAILAVGLLALAAPTFYGLATQIWQSSEQGHGPIILAVSAWLLWRSWGELNAPTEVSPSIRASILLLSGSLLLYLFGRTQRILSAQTLAIIGSLLACIWLMCGRRQSVKVWFPIFFLFFLIPLPAALVDAITQPLKLAVSTVASYALNLINVPTARTGVILQVGQYQLLVADACAGLHTLFSLEAMGLLYLNITKDAPIKRNIALAILIVPISFTANVIRVLALSLITFYFGDAAGQGFLHNFAGMVLYLSALGLIVSLDSVLRRIFPEPAEIDQ